MYKYIIRLFFSDIEDDCIEFSFFAKDDLNAGEYSKFVIKGINRLKKVKESYLLRHYETYLYCGKIVCND